MAKVAVVYWSGTGNTEAMKDLVVKGITEAEMRGIASWLCVSGGIGADP